MNHTIWTRISTAKHSFQIQNILQYLVCCTATQIQIQKIIYKGTFVNTPEHYLKILKIPKMWANSELEGLPVVVWESCCRYMNFQGIECCGFCCFKKFLKNKQHTINYLFFIYRSQSTTDWIYTSNNQHKAHLKRTIREESFCTCRC